MKFLSYNTKSINTFPLFKLFLVTFLIGMIVIHAQYFIHAQTPNETTPSVTRITITGEMHKTTNATTPSSTPTTTSSTNFSDVPSYYVYSPRYDYALAYNPQKMVVSDFGYSFEISTRDEFIKYVVTPLTGKKLDDLLKRAHLGEYNFASDEKLLSAIKDIFNEEIYYKDKKFDDIQKLDDSNYLQKFTYKAIDYSKVLDLYTKNDIQKDKLYSDFNGLILYRKAQGEKGFYAIIAYNVKDEKNENKNLLWIADNIYSHPTFVKETEYTIADTNVTITFNPKEWFTVTNRNSSSSSITFDFYNAKMESDINLAKRYSTTAHVGIYVNKVSGQQVDEKFLKTQIEYSAKGQDKKVSITEKKTEHITLYCTESESTTDSMYNTEEVKQSCYAGTDDFYLWIPIQYTKGSKGEEALNKLLNSIKFNESNKQDENAFIYDLFGLLPKTQAQTNNIQNDATSPATVIGALGTLKIFSLQCSSLTIPNTNLFRKANLSGKKYQMCLPATGSGFLITDDGYVISNAHVLKTPAIQDVLMTYIISLKAQSAGRILPEAVDGGLTKDFNRIAGQVISAYRARGYNLGGTSTASAKIIATLWQELLKNITPTQIQKTVTNNWIATGINAEFTVKNNKFQIANENDVVKINVIDAYDITGNSFPESKVPMQPDLALGKATKTIKALPLPLISDPQKIQIGSKVTLVGFPGVIEQSSLLSKKSTYPTLTFGHINSIRDAASGGFKIIQLDASASHGNSGGPMLNTSAEVVGILTWGFTGQDDVADFAGAVHGSEIIKLLSKKNVQYNHSKLTKKALDGVNAFNQGYYSQAISIFKEIKNINPQYFGSIIDPLIAQADEQIKKGNNKNGTAPGTNATETNVSIVLMAVIILVVLVVSVVWYMQNKNKTISNPPFDPNTPPTPSDPVNGNPQNPPTNNMEQPTAPNTNNNVINNTPTASPNTPNNASNLVNNQPTNTQQSQIQSQNINVNMQPQNNISNNVATQQPNIAQPVQQHVINHNTDTNITNQSNINPQPIQRPAQAQNTVVPNNTLEKTASSTDISNAPQTAKIESSNNTPQTPSASENPISQTQNNISNNQQPSLESPVKNITPDAMAPAQPEGIEVISEQTPLSTSQDYEEPEVDMSILDKVDELAKEYAEHVPDATEIAAQAKLHELTERVSKFTQSQALANNSQNQSQTTTNTSSQDVNQSNSIPSTSVNNSQNLTPTFNSENKISNNPENH